MANYSYLVKVMTNKKVLVGSLVAGGAALLASVPSHAQYSPTVPFRGKLFKASIDVER